MRRAGPLLAALLFGVNATAAPTIAVVAFANHSGQPEFDALGAGLADMLLTDLAVSPTLQFVERARINDVLGELQLADSGYLDPTTAAKMGRGVGATYLLTGAITSVKPILRVDARLIEVESAAIAFSRSATGPTEEFFLVEKELVHGLLDGLDLALSAREQARLGRVQTESFDAFNAWSQSIVALDHGEVDDARAQLAVALSVDARFHLAEDALNSLKESLVTSNRERSRLLDERSASLLKRIETIAQSDDVTAAFKPLRLPLIQTISVLPWDDQRALSMAVLTLHLPNELLIVDNAGGPSINEFFHQNYALWSLLTNHRAEGLAWAESFLKRYPESPYHLPLRMRYSELITHIEAENAGQKALPASLKAHEVDALEIRCRDTLDPKRKVNACAQWAKSALDAQATRMWLRAARDAGDLAELTRLLEWLGTQPVNTLQPDEVQTVLTRLEGQLKRASVWNTTPPSTLKDAVRAAKALVRVAKPHDALTLLHPYLNQDHRDEISLWQEAIRAGVATHDSAVIKQIIEATRRNCPQLEQQALAARDRFDAHVKRDASIPARVLFQLSRRYEELHLYDASARTLLQIGRDWPDFSDLSKPNALYLAALSFQKAKTVDGRSQSLAIYKELIERFPDFALQNSLAIQLVNAGG